MPKHFAPFAAAGFKRTFIDPEFTFSHIGFDWLQPLPGNGMYLYFLLMATLGLGIMAGYKYRLSLGAFTVLWAGIFLMQKESYNNHYYLNPEIRSDFMPQWFSWIMIFQISVVYFFAVVSNAICNGSTALL